MRRKTKNIINILLIIIMLGVLCFTIYYSKSNSNLNNEIKIGNNTNIPSVNENNSEQNNQVSSNELGGTPPEKPSGNMESGETPPEKPEGNNNVSNGNNDMLIMPNNTNYNHLKTIYYILFIVESLILSFLLLVLILSKCHKKELREVLLLNNKIIFKILLLFVLTVLFTYGSVFVTKKINTNNQVKMDGINNNSNKDIKYNSEQEIKENKSISKKTYNTDSKDTNVLSVTDKAKVFLNNVNVTKKGDTSNQENSNFYGINSAIIAKSGSTLTIKNSSISTNASGANGVFSYGESSVVNISDSKINTKKDNSGGIMTTGGGTTKATNLTITTAGTSSAAIRSDRGGGTVNVVGGTYKTTGVGSPSIYSTAKIVVRNAKLSSTSSEGIVIEGKNSVILHNTELTNTNNKLNGQSTTYKNIFLYQSMSGDAEAGESKFISKNSKITTNKGDTFYITNTTSKIILNNNSIINNDKTGNFLRAKSDSWGNKGSNGGKVTLVMTNQKVEGNIVIDGVSTLYMTLKSNSSYTGTINKDNSAKSIKLNLDKSSKIKLTGNSYVKKLNNKDTKNSNIDFNGYKLFVNGKSIN